jgi:hypothetical protein
MTTLSAIRSSGLQLSNALRLDLGCPYVAYDGIGAMKVRLTEFRRCAMTKARKVLVRQS